MKKKSSTPVKSEPRSSFKRAGTSKSSTKSPNEKKKSYPGAWVKRPAKGEFEVDPKDANTVNAIKAKLQEIREYKKILAQDGLSPDDDDKQRESDLIKQLIRIEKGLSPTKPAKKKVKKKRPVVMEKVGKGKKPVPRGEA